MENELDRQDQPAAPSTDKSVDESGRRSRWLLIAFVALVATLVWLGPAGGGAVAYSLIAGDPYACGGG